MSTRVRSVSLATRTDEKSKVISFRNTVMVWRTLLVLATGLLLVQGAKGQERSLDVVIEHIAGPNLYLGAGTGEGITTGDTLLVMKQGVPVGDWRVISSTRSRAVVTFATKAFPVTRGDTFTLMIVRSAATVASAVDSIVMPGVDRPSLMAPPVERPIQRRQTRRPIQVTGRIFVEANTLRSTTRSTVVSNGATSRVFSTPAAGIRASVTHLPGDLRANISVRASQRFSTGSLIQQDRVVRVYQASLEKKFERIPAQVEAGRFYSPFEDYSGYWDGLLVRYGDRLGGGMAVGFQPNRADEGFTADYPKASFFLDFRHKREGFAYEADLSFHQVQPQARYSNHTFFGWSQQVRWNRLRLSQDFQLDRNTVTNTWVVSRMQLRTTVPLTNRLYLTSRYTLRQPYLLYSLGEPISYRRDQGMLGLGYNTGTSMLGVNMTVSQYAGDEPNYTTAFNYSFPRTGFWGLGFNGSVSYWTRGEQSTALYASSGLNRTFGPVQSRLRYTYYHSDLGGRVLATHAVHLTLNVPLLNRLNAALQVRSQWGDNLSSTSLYSSLWMRL